MKAIETFLPTGTAFGKETPSVQSVLFTGIDFVASPSGVTSIKVGIVKPADQLGPFFKVRFCKGALLVFVIVVVQITLVFVSITSFGRVNVTLAVGISSLYMAVISSLPSKVALNVGVVVLFNVLGLVFPLYHPWKV